jgi:hypothetical protein
MTRLLDVLEAYLEWRGWGWLRLDGSTASGERGELVAEFNAPGEKGDMHTCMLILYLIIILIITNYKWYYCFYFLYIVIYLCPYLRSMCRCILRCFCIH